MPTVNNINLIKPQEYHFAINRLREFFLSKNFVETAVQHRLSILAACEDPTTVSSFHYAGKLWPLPQTGQMWLEYELLTKPGIPGFYCISTSYRSEANPIPGRHDLIFPMFEFETHGNISSLQQLEEELLEFLGFGPREKFKQGEYEEIAKHFGTKEIKAEHEELIMEEFGPIFFLKKFPQHTSPFWNMKKQGNYAQKIDVILYGVETIGSAERSCDPQQMHHSFCTISNGMYADLLYSQFGKERVEQELKKFLNHKFIPRCGGGIGITRLIRALKMAGILK